MPCRRTLPAMSSAPFAQVAGPVVPGPARWFDDLQAFATAILLVSLGLSLLAGAGLLTGGTPGLAFLLSYATGLPLGAALMLVNAPFYLLSWRELGPRFTLRTLAAVAALSAGVEAVPRLFTVSHVQPLYAAVAGGTLIGVGLLVLFRHRASLGGINVLALALNRRRGWRAGAVQMAVDATILLGAFAVVAPQRVGWSILGSLMVNGVLLCNHRPGAAAAR